MNVPESSTGARSDVLAFYRELPFNFRVDAKTHAASVRKGDPLRAYPPLVAVLAGGKTLLDVGCGAGWLVNSAAYHHRALASGIDFNSVAVERAREVSKTLGLTSSFEVADLFTFRPERRPEVVTSIGVLHHTNDCLGAIQHLARNVVAPGGHMFIGLYHLHGRRPFLDHFAAMRRDGASEDAMYEEFKILRVGASGGTDEVFLRSWFRDQVLHPHETCHTLAEIWPLLDDLGFTLKSTTINRFSPIASRSDVLAMEPPLEDAGREALVQRRYFPGFFAFLAQAPA